MHTWVLATALKQDVMTIPSPSRCQRGMDNCTPVALAAELRMRDDILEKSVLTTRTEDVGDSDKHAG
jgi:hypothetical protein